MALIKLIASELENVQSQITKLSDKANDCSNIVAAVKNGLDMEISAKRNIEGKLDAIKRDLLKHSENIKSYANVLNEVINEFVSTDKLASVPQVDNIANVIGAIGAGGIIGGGIIGGTTIIGKIAEKQGYIDTGTWGGKYGGFKAGHDLKLLGNAATLFGSSSLSITDNSFLTGLFDAGKDTKKIHGVLETVARIVNGGDTPEWFEDITLGFGDGVGKGIGYLSDIEKAMNAVKEQDVEALGELLGKYGVKSPLKDIVKTTVGGTSAEVGLLVDLIYSDFESAIDVSNDIATDLTNVLSDSNSNIMDYAKVIGDIYRAPDKVIAQGFINVVGDYADNIGGAFDIFGIVDAPEDGYIDFYKDALSDIKNMYRTFGAEDATSILVDSFRETVSENFNNTIDTLGDIGSGISNFFKDLF